MKNIINEAECYADSLHTLRNYTYGDYPYHKHLEMVYNIAKEFIFLIPEEDRENVLCACWLHDTIEDCGITYNNLKDKFNKDIAEIVISVTNDIRGRTRKERAESSYPVIRSNILSNFVKICDRIANMEFSKSEGSSMFNKYKKELDDFKKNLYVEEFELDIMWHRLYNIN